MAVIGDENAGCAPANPRTDGGSVCQSVAVSHNLLPLKSLPPVYERSINGRSAEERLAVRQTLSRPLVDDLHVCMREQAARLSRGHDLVKAFNYILKRWARSGCT